ncbi:hypothetical protein DFH09DRAFT_223155 [Mycena vulgaris]|nr:hypothetical protein DFH09DRAFT_223155 [Mycena vulgaris]
MKSNTSCEDFTASHTRCSTPAPHRAQRPLAFVVNGSFIRSRRRPPSPTRVTTHIEGFVARTSCYSCPAPSPPTSSPPSSLSSSPRATTALPCSAPAHPAGAAMYVQVRGRSRSSGALTRQGDRGDRGTGVVFRATGRWSAVRGWSRGHRKLALGLRGGDLGCFAAHSLALARILGFHTCRTRRAPAVLKNTTNPLTALEPPSSAPARSSSRSRGCAGNSRSRWPRPHLRLQIHVLKNDTDFRDAYGGVIAHRASPGRDRPAHIFDFAHAPRSSSRPSFRCARHPDAPAKEGPLRRSPAQLLPLSLRSRTRVRFSRSGAARNTMQNDLAAGPRFVALQSALDDLYAHTARVNRARAAFRLLADGARAS